MTPEQIQVAQQWELFFTILGGFAIMALTAWYVSRQQETITEMRRKNFLHNTEGAAKRSSRSTPDSTPQSSLPQR